ncbi:hypothetical protein HYS91_00245 [Candidatus Daviesbacteria bacterium]|nr:hypothetical protein [Candidatus Daviesbacteria bacterium]
MMLSLFMGKVIIIGLIIALISIFFWNHQRVSEEGTKKLEFSNTKVDT